MNSKIQTALGFLGPIHPLMHDEQVTEIMVNGPDDVWVKRFGARAEKTDIRFSAEQIRAAITVLASASQRQVGDETSSRDKAKIVSAGLPGFRVEALMPPVAVRGPAFSLRKLASKLVTLADYVAQGAMTAEVASLLQHLVQSHRNLFIAGATGSGKTTLTNALLQVIAPSERLVVIETIHELLVSSPNHLLLEADEEQGYTINRLLLSALRLLPDRIIIGEVRGQEAFGLLNAANTGHPGSIATLHANSAPETLQRLEDMALMGEHKLQIEAVKWRIANTKPVIVYIEQVHREGKWRPTLTQIVEVTGFRDEQYQFQTIYQFNKGAQS